MVNKQTVDEQANRKDKPQPDTPRSFCKNFGKSMTAYWHYNTEDTLNDGCRRSR